MKLPLLQAHHGAAAPAGPYREEPRARTDALARMAPAWQIAPMAPGASGGPGAAAGRPAPSGSAPPRYVYMMSQGVRPSFPSLSVEKAFRQALPADQADLPLTKDMFFDVLGRTQNLYIAREMCWLSSAQGTTNYVVAPRSQEELIGLIASIDPGDLETRTKEGTTPVPVRSGDSPLPVLVGARGPTAPPGMCNGVELPVLTCMRVINLTWRSMVATIEQALLSKYSDEKDRTRIIENAGELWRVMYETCNGDGDGDDKRALVYVAINYMEVYVRTYQMMTGQWLGDRTQIHEDPLATYALSSVRAMPASVQGDRKLVNVVFDYQRLDNHYGAMTQQYACTVDVTGLYPFISGGLSLYVPSPV